MGWTTERTLPPFCAGSGFVSGRCAVVQNGLFCRSGEPARVARRRCADPAGQVQASSLGWSCSCAPARARRSLPAASRTLLGRPGLTMRRDDHDNDHQERSGQKYQEWGGDAHEQVVLACLPLTLL
jgi:hypothetical protein